MPSDSTLQTLLLVLPLLLGGAWWAGLTLGRLRERHRLSGHLHEHKRAAVVWDLLHAADLIWRCDKELRVISRKGPHAEVLSEQDVGARVEEVLQAVQTPTLGERLASGAAVIDCHVRRRHDAATWLLSAVPLHDEVGRFTGFHGVLKPAKTLTDAPARSTAETASADDAMSFSYTVSHDLRAPLRVVDGFARILKEDHGGQLDRVGNDHLDRVLSAAARMNQMIDALLAMARLSTQPLARQTVDLSQLAQFVVEDLRRGAPDRVIDVQIDPDMRVLGDPTLLRQVLENLLGNAWKYTQRVDRPTVSVMRETCDGRPCVAVRDNGAGFDMRSADRLFGLFQRLHSASEFPGTGVGLASVKRIVARHGGRIWAESGPGQGATFRFTLWE